MNLREYLFFENISQADMSKLLRINRSYLSQIVRGAKKPSIKIQEDIEKATNGKIPVSYWESDDYEKYVESNKQKKIA